MGVRFVKKSTVKGCLVGHLKDDEGRNVEVRFSPDAMYHCTCKGKLLTKVTAEELTEEFNRVFSHKMDWRDVILITVERGVIGTCPPIAEVKVQANPIHIAQRPDGSWVAARWDPESVYKQEQVIALPEDMTLPCKFTDKYCGGNTVKMLVPYSEATLAKVKAYQVEYVDAANNFIEELLK